MIQTKSPAYLHELLPPRRIPICGSASAHLFHEIQFNKNKYRNIFFPNSIKVWNNLTEDFRTCASISIFKNIMISLIRPTKKSIFGILEPPGILRMLQAGDEFIEMPQKGT